ncbi:MAG: outer membrane lipoprotein carrier protein LolA [Nitrospinae bacterium CG11_big_fil_rev_8_21_14_0_20_56_8]|nr:MAG: outer membrane lipoprotein carrier protein LolA [Nitrospinae bacterium CG11_big_fil_rev_8_21_14_0_20_56_8]
MNSLRLLGSTLVFLLAFPALSWSLSDEQNAVDAIQKRYESVQTFEAKFVQKSYVKMMGKSQEARGEVKIKKPGKMKWIYTAPDPQVLISNENVLWLYVPEEEQVSKMPLDNVYSSNTPALFLSGKGKLTEAFQVSRVLLDNDKITLVMVPNPPDNNLEKMVLYADNKNFQITGSSVYDKLGNRTEILFTDIRVNQEITEDIFEFQIPAGVELLDFTTEIR